MVRKNRMSPHPIENNGHNMLSNPSCGVQQVYADSMLVYSGTDLSTGCDRLSVIEENLVIAFTDVGGDDNNRLTVILNQAYRV